MGLILFTEMRLLESPVLTPLDFCLWGWMKSERYATKVDTSDELLFAFWMLLVKYTNVNTNSNEQHVIFAQELQGALRSVVRFLKIYCELKVIL